MSNEEIFNELLKVHSILAGGLDCSACAVGLTHEDSEKITTLRDSCVYALALVKVAQGKILKKEESDYEKTKTKK